MIKHILDVKQRALNSLNECDLVVVAMDLPLYALAKRIHWQWSDQYGILMLGRFHKEMAFFSALGDWVDASHWIKSPLQLLGNKVSRLRCAHEVSVCSLDILMRRAYNQENQSKDWQLESEKEEQCPQFRFWSLTKEMELLLLQFNRSLRAGNFYFMWCA